MEMSRFQTQWKRGLREQFLLMPVPTTSNILLHYPEDRYVAAALELFASVALMFWYVLRLFMSRH